MRVSVPVPATRQLEAEIVSTVEPSERLWMVMSPDSAVTSSLNTRVKSVSTCTLVSPSAGVVDTSVGGADPEPGNNSVAPGK